MDTALRIIGLTAASLAGPAFGIAVLLFARAVRSSMYGWKDR